MMRTRQRQTELEKSDNLCGRDVPRICPLSLENPKPLWPVRGEKLVERLIRQAKNAGFSDITVVVGYKKALFGYLRDAFGVSLSENADFRSISGREALIEFLLYGVASVLPVWINNVFDIGRGCLCGSLPRI